MTAYADKNLYERIIDRQTYMEQVRQPIEADCDKIIDHYNPDLTRFTEYKGKGKPSILGAKIYEGTAPWAVNLMADGFQGNLVSHSIEWFRYSMAENKFKGNDEVNKWLQKLEDYMYSVYRSSNFYPALGPFCRGGISVGSPVIIPEQDKISGRTFCIVPHPTERYLLQNRFGETDVLHLKSEWTIRNAVLFFGKENMSKAVQDSYDNGRHNEKVTIIRAIYFYLDPIFEGLDGEEKPRWLWPSYYVEKTTDPDKKKPLMVDGYWSKPFSVWHYRKDQSMTYAVTPAWLSYFDANSLNKMRKSLIMAAQKSVEKSWWASSAFYNKLKLYPKAINWYDPAQYAHKPEPLEDKVDYPFGIEIEDRIAKSVERWFHVKMWMMLSVWAEEQKAPPTATQIIQMAGEKAVLLGPRVGMFLNNLEEIDNRFVDIEQRAGRLPEPPAIVLEYSNGKINPEFIGPLAQLQKQFHGIRRIQTSLESANMVFALDPLVRHKIIAEVLLEHVLEENKFYQDAIRSDDEYRELIAAIAERQTAAEGIQMGKDVADAVPKLSKAIEPGSPAAALMEAAA